MRQRTTPQPKAPARSTHTPFPQTGPAVALPAFPRALKGSGTPSISHARGSTASSSSRSPLAPAEQPHLPSLVGPRRRAGLALASLLATGALLALTAAPAAASEPCPNQAFRTGFSAGLPECRAYEMVTPPDKGGGAPGGLILAEGRPGFEVASDGNRVAFFSHDSFPGSVAGTGSYLATRGGADWSSQNLVPPQSEEYGERCAPRTGMQLYSADLSQGILADGNGQAEGCGTDDPNLVPGEPQGMQNLFLRDNDTGTYGLIDVTPPGVVPADAILQAGSSDLSHVVFVEAAQLTPDAPSGTDDLYEWSGGAVSLVTYIPAAPATECGSGGPACEPAAGAIAGGLSGGIHHAVSADGSRVFFGVAGNLYVRLNGTRTVQLDASQAGGSGGAGDFQTASMDGTQVFFTDDASAGLTADTVPGSGQNLYRYNTVTGQLSDLTPQPVVDGGAVLGAGEDGSYVYFTAAGALAPGATAGQTNIYLYHAGTTTFVATTSNLGPTRASANGLFIAFTSTASLTGYDNTDANTAQPDQEIYLYDAASNRLDCASCRPTGDPPTAGSSLLEPQRDGQVDFFSTYPLAYDPNSVSDSGQVFFDTEDALLSADTNGMRDVYEYAAGQLHLLSTGSALDDSWFANATPSGSDVFILTPQQLLPQDGDTSPDLYDARVDGGFPSAPSGVPCEGDGCKGAGSTAPVAMTPASATFSGPGNEHHAPRKRHRKKHHPKHRQANGRRAHRTVGHNHGGDE